MSKLKKLFEEVNIPREKLEELAQSLGSNPMAAIGLIQQLNLPPEFFPKVMSIVTENPDAAGDLASELGLSDVAIDEMEKKLKGSLTPTEDS